MTKPNEASRILVIEDDPAILESIRDVLELEGYQVETSTRYGEYSADAFRAPLPNLIILDMLLSGHDGRKICKQLKSRKETRDIPVILISAHPEARNTAFEAGADDFIAKPFDIDQLAEAAARWLYRK
jgi:DNA-binding response OmpR family regulator